MHELPGGIGYAVKMQIICDYRLKIRHVVIGYQDSVHGARIFAEPSIGTTPQSFVCEKQFIAGDSAYPLQPNLITPFRQNSSKYDEGLRSKIQQTLFKIQGSRRKLVWAN